MFRKKIKALLFEKFKNKIECFDVKKTNKLFFRREQNYKIEFILETKLFNKRVYELKKKQITIIKAYTNEIFAKKFIRINISNFLTSILVVKKSKEDFRICVDYRTLNVFIVKNRNFSLLIKKIFARLCVVKFYIKLDVIATFNEIRIQKSDEYKTVFFTRYNLFEYIVMFFNFCNTFETFQFFINKILREFLNNFCFVYLNDIFIYS